MKKFSILSIDFDFFQIIPDGIETFYPDGIDLPSSLSSIVWASHYATDFENKLMEVKIDDKNIRNLNDILIKQEKRIPVLICNSHKNIYDFILHNCPNTSYLMDIVNIDLHHDMYNDNDYLDCGNWIKHVRNRYKNSNLLWITRDERLNHYGFTKENFNENTSFDFNLIKNKKFDAVFLCRSDAWFPPHLDCYFMDIVETIINHFIFVYGEKMILKCREYKTVSSEIEKIYKEIKIIP